MNEHALKLTTYFGERDRAGAGFLADALIDIYARREVRASVLLRGVEGFGVKHHLQTARLLTLSEDLPVVSVAVDTQERIEACLPDVRAVQHHGLITLERARLLVGASQSPAAAGRSAKLTVYLGRGQRLGEQPAYVSIVERLRETGVAGATVLLGVDGTSHGVRRRASLIGRNADVPLMLIAIGDGERIAATAASLADDLPDPLMTIERVQVCKRDGQLLETPGSVPDTGDPNVAVWRKLTVHAGEQARHDGAPLYPQLVRRLREGGALGATVVRGIWGYHGNHEPHGDRLLAIRRRVPVVTVIVDTPQRSRRWFGIIDAMTDRTGLVTSELVPAVRASGPQVERGGLRLARGNAEP